MQRLSCQGAPVQACASIFKIVLTPLHLFLSFTWKGSVSPKVLVFFQLMLLSDRVLFLGSWPCVCLLSRFCTLHGLHWNWCLAGMKETCQFGSEHVVWGRKDRVIDAERVDFFFVVFVLLKYGIATRLRTLCISLWEDGLRLQQLHCLFCLQGKNVLGNKK